MRLADARGSVWCIHPIRNRTLAAGRATGLSPLRTRLGWDFFML